MTLQHSVGRGTLSHQRALQGVLKINFEVCGVVVSVPNMFNLSEMPFTCDKTLMFDRILICPVGSIFLPHRVTAVEKQYIALSCLFPFELLFVGSVAVWCAGINFDFSLCVSSIILRYSGSV